MKKAPYKSFLISLVSLVIIDSLWLFIIMGDVYTSLLSNFPAPNPAPIWAAFGVWILMSLGIVYFVLPRIQKKSECFLHGAIYGLILYGVFELTNYVILAGWSLEMVILDMLWGMILCSINSYITYRYSVL